MFTPSYKHIAHWNFVKFESKVRKYFCLIFFSHCRHCFRRTHAFHKPAPFKHHFKQTKNKIIFAFLRCCLKIKVSKKQWIWKAKMTRFFFLKCYFFKTQSVAPYGLFIMFIVFQWAMCICLSVFGKMIAFFCFVVYSFLKHFVSYIILAFYFAFTSF